MIDVKIHKLKVTGDRTIHCSGCENSLKFTLKSLPGVREVAASHESQTIDVTLIPEEIEIDKVIAELDWIGYQVERV